MAGDVFDAVVVEVQLFESQLALRVNVFQRVETHNEVVSEVDALELREALEPEALQRGNLEVDEVDVGGVERDVGRELLVCRQDVHVCVRDRREPVRLFDVRHLVRLLLLLFPLLALLLVQLLVNAIHVSFPVPVLVLRVRAGEVQAFEVFVHRFKPLCRRWRLCVVGHCCGVVFFWRYRPMLDPVPVVLFQSREERFIMSSVRAPGRMGPRASDASLRLPAYPAGHTTGFLSK